MQDDAFPWKRHLVLLPGNGDRHPGKVARSDEGKRLGEMSGEGNGCARYRVGECSRLGVMQHPLGSVAILVVEQRCFGRHVRRLDDLEGATEYPGCGEFRRCGSVADSTAPGHVTGRP